MLARSFISPPQMEGAPTWCPKVRAGGVTVLARSLFRRWPIWCPEVRLCGVTVLERRVICGGPRPHLVSESAFRRRYSASAKFHLGSGVPHLASISAFRRRRSASAQSHHPLNGGGPHLAPKSAFRRRYSAIAKFHLGPPAPHPPKWTGRPSGVQKCV